MKHMLFFSFALGFAQLMLAQQDSLQKIGKTNDIIENNLPLPEFVKKPYFFEINSNSLVELEKPRLSSKAKLTGFGKASAFVIIDNHSSAVKIKRADTLNFIVKVLPGTDPTAEFELVAFTIKKDKREARITEVNNWNATVKNVYEPIPFNIKKVAEGAYQLIVKNLQPGEYFFKTYDNSSTLIFYAFSLE